MARAGRNQRSLKDSLGSKVIKPVQGKGKDEKTKGVAKAVQKGATRQSVPPVQPKKADVGAPAREMDPEDAAIKRCAQEIRDSHIASPVHQGKQSIIQTILKNFDNSYKYGPCVGLTRLARWQRAQRLGLKPPTEVFTLLDTRQGYLDASVRDSFLEGQV